MNRTCNGDRFEANGQFYYRCIFDGTLLKEQPVDKEMCPHCARPVAGRDHGILAVTIEVKTTTRVTLPNLWDVDLEQRTCTTQ